MRELGNRSPALRALIDRLELSQLQAKRNSLLKKNELKKTQPYWRSQSPGDHAGSAEEALDLIISPPGNAPLLFSFMAQLEEALDTHDTYGSIMRIVPCCDQGTVITILAQPSKLSDLLDKLGNMPGVEKVEEEPLVDPAVPALPKRFSFLTGLGVIPSKRIRVALKGTEMAEEDLVPVLA